MQNELIECANKDCKTLWENENELKHMQFHRHITAEGKEIFTDYDRGENYLDWRNYTEHGIPSKNITICHNQEEFCAMAKKWKCLICGIKKTNINGNK